MVTRRTDVHQFGKGRVYRPRSKRGLMALYGSTGVRDSWFALDRAYWPDGYFHDTVDGLGHPVASMDMATKWANESFHTDMAALETAAFAGDFAPFDYHMLGVSMGGVSSCMWAIRHPERVRSIQLVIPAIAPLATQANNYAGFAAEITAAHGGTVPDSANPSTDESFAALAAFPIRIYYSTNDTVTPIAETTTFIEGVQAAGGDIEAISLGAIGHTFGDGGFGISAYFNGETVAEFIAAHD